MIARPAFAAAFLVTRRSPDPVVRAVASRRAWEDDVRAWIAREAAATSDALARHRDHVAAHRDRRVADGMCSACLLRSPPAGYRTCGPCRDQIVAAQRRRESDRIARGLCTKCGVRPLAGKVRCAECLAIDARRAAAYKTKREGLR